MYLKFKTMLIPPALQPGDTLAIIATARKNIQDNLQPTIQLLEMWGLKIVLGTTIGLDHHQLAGTDQQRAADLQKQLDNPNIHAIWIVRGGYGTVRIIDLIDFSNFKKKPKWIIGFSDVSILHSKINNLGIASLHSFMPINTQNTSLLATQSLQKALFGKPISYHILSNPDNKIGATKAKIVGGNLSVICSQLGSKTQLKTRNKILFLEDLDEQLYHIDRMIIALKRSGMLQHLKGLIVGHFTSMHDNAIPWGQTANQIIASHCQDFDFPILFDFPAGHIDDNRSLIFQKTATLIVTKSQSELNF